MSFYRDTGRNGPPPEPVFPPEAPRTDGFPPFFSFIRTEGSFVLFLAIHGHSAGQQKEKQKSNKEGDLVASPVIVAPSPPSGPISRGLAENQNERYSD